MNIQLNDLGQSIMNAGDRAKYDLEAKNLLSNKPFLAWILKYTAKEFADLTIDEIIPYIDNDPSVSSISAVPGSTNRPIEGVPTENGVIRESVVVYDIRFYARIPGKVYEEQFNLMIDVEMQNEPDPGYDLVSRGVLYCGRMLSEQMGRNVSRIEGTTKYRYRNLQKVYSIWIVKGCSEDMAYTISRYSMTHEALSGKFKDEARSDLVNVAMIRLPKEGAEDKAVNKPTPLHSLLETILSQTLPPGEKLRRLQNEFGITVTEKIRKEVTDMCNLSQGIVNKANEDTVRRMLRIGKYSDEEISAASDVSISRVKEIRKEEKTKTEELVTV